MKNIAYAGSFERLWLSEAEAENKLYNKLFCITFLLCNPAASIGFYLAGDPLFLTIIYTHCISGSLIAVLLLLHYKKVITGQQMSFLAQLMMIGFYAYLLAQPHRSYAQSCLNLTLGVIFTGLILRWPVRYALVSSLLSMILYPSAIYFFGEPSAFKMFFTEGGVFLLLAQFLFPFVMKVSVGKDKREFYYRYNLQEQNIELEKQKTIAENATKAKSDFLSIMSHEIRTPLNGIVGIVHIMMDEDQNQKNRNELLTTLKFSSDHLMAVVNDVLDFSKINSDHIQLDEFAFDPGLLFENLRKTFVPRAGEKKLDLIFDIDERLPSHIVSDSVRLNQIITNLIHNAVKFTETGYVMFAVREVARDEKTVRLHFAVKDSGIGIPAEEQPTIFESFTQVRPQEEQENKGTGLGLAISKELLRLFKSDIHLESEPGKGSVFSFEIQFPYLEEKVAAKPAVREKIVTAIAYPQAKVLIADDNKINVTLATMLLKRKNILFEVAQNGKEAYELFLQGGFNLILMDLRMPVMDGFESTALIRKIDQRIPIIALTASALESEKDRVHASGFTGYLAKPFIPEDFYAYIFPFLGVQTAKVS
ncbi:ATP-binding protein [Dyadobacter sp. LJ53]|uniref:ATP-binding protein n=1 Tax=Dyadobacter chenwenxiniae TaxID=2906456 RepID=UPI001F2709BB|nr:ATP-binding protein [Dyadobacter chenwenxiniae]MCF0052286.1 ATP-binding protein [Dyadobacter chenwenxiniae]